MTDPSKPGLNKTTSPASGRCILMYFMIAVIPDCRNHDSCGQEVLTLYTTTSQIKVYKRPGRRVWVYKAKSQYALVTIHTFIHLSFSRHTVHNMSKCYFF